VLKTAESFWKSVSKMCESTFFMMKQSNLKTEIEWEAKHCQIVLGEASASGIQLIEIFNKLLFAIVSMTHPLSMTHSLVFPFLVLTVLNLLFYTSFCWKWPASCHVFVKWPVGQQ